MGVMDTAAMGEADHEDIQQPPSEDEERGPGRCDWGRGYHDAPQWRAGAAAGWKIFAMRQSIGHNLVEAPRVYAADILDQSVGHNHPFIQRG